MKLIGLTIIMYFVTSYSWSLNTLFLNPFEFFPSIIESHIQTINQQNQWEKIQNIEPPKKVTIKTITNGNTQSSVDPEVQESININTWYNPLEEEINEKNESVDTDPLLDSDEYEEIVFSDVFDSEYRNED